MDLPARFGKYELLEHLATGGMSEVYLARSFGVEGFQKRVVIKRILPGLARSPRFVNMFIQEAKITAELSHPNIVQVFELGRVGDDHYIAMEHIEGRDLTAIKRALAREGRRMPVPLAIHVTASLLRGLAYAHALSDAHGQPLNLVHRDVSPHNVMVSFHGEVKLFDFGIARLAGEAESRQTNRPGGGKFAYMSPEQARGQPLDGRSDIFSAGIVLYEQLVGHRLFDHPDPAEKLRLVEEAVVPDPRVEVRELPDALWETLQRMLARDPEDRFRRAEEAEEDLRALLFREGMRADAAALRDLVAELFPEAGECRPGFVDLRGLSKDIGRLDEPSDPSGSGSPSLTPAGGGRVLVGAGERKTVVVMVIEVVGFTDLTSHRDPQDIVRGHGQFLARVRSAVEDYGGFVESFQDDVLVVFFGVPRAGEHDVERALACAGELLRLCNRSGRAEVPFDLSIGVHRGEINIGPRDDPGLQYLARGDTMKLARRLCAEADMGQVLVSDAIVALVGEGFGLRPGPELRLKGQAGTRRTFALAGPRRRVVPPAGRWLVRADELDRLQEALAALAEGKGGLLVIQGEAGTGKTRLLRELVALARKHDVALVAGRALPFGGDRPLAPFRDVVAAVVGIDPGDAPQRVRERLGLLGRFRVGDAERALLGSLFAVESGRQKIEPTREGLVGAMIALVRGLAEDRPLILAFEDVQYLDGLECAVLGQLVRATRHEPVICLFTCRAELPREIGETDWVVRLGPLSPAARADLVADLAGVREVDPRLLALVERTAEGNPLYTEEVVGALLRASRIRLAGDRAILVDPEEDPRLPPGLEGLIAARIDALGDRSRVVLQVASVVGATFSCALLGAAVGYPDTPALLEELVQRGLVVPDGDAGEGRCAFCSTLVWEVVRRGIMGITRRDIHLMVAAGIEQLYADRLDGHRLVLARHCAAGGRFLDATHHANRAGDLLRRQQLMEQAAACWEEGIAWVEEARAAGEPVAAIAPLEAELRLKTGAAWALTGEPRRGELHLQVALDLAGELLDAEIEARAQLELGRFYAAHGKLTLAGVHLEEARRASLSAPLAHSQLTPLEGSDPGFEHPETTWRRVVAVETLEALGHLAHQAGRDQEAEDCFRQALDLAGGDDVLAARASLGLAHRHIRAGDSAVALALLQTARDKALAAGDRILAGRAINNIGIVHQNLGHYHEALRQYRAALELRQGLGYRRGMVTNLHNIGDVHLLLGDTPRAWAAFAQSRELASEIAWDVGELMNDVFLDYLEARRALAEGAADPDVGSFVGRLERDAARADDLGQLEIAVTARWLLGRLLGDVGRREDARRVMKEGLDLARRREVQALVTNLEKALAHLG